MNIRMVVLSGAAAAVVAVGVGLAMASDGPGDPADPTSSGKPAATATLQPAAAAPAQPGAANGAATATSPASQTAVGSAKPSGMRQPRLSQAQLSQLLAPVALYPDQLLDQVLMASTYPIEVVEAARWIKMPAHRDLRGAVLLASLKPLGLDPSVMALVPFPRVLAIMSDRLQWTVELGNAFLAQQADVLAAVQRLRHAALAAGTLDPPKCRCKVVHQAAAIAIEPANPAAVYVPVCNPVVAYGPWPYPVYPPVVFPVPVGFVWAPYPFFWPYPLVNVAWYGPLWGWAAFDWWHFGIVVNVAAFNVVSFGHPWFHNAVWVHDPSRPEGATFADRAGAARFGARAGGAAVAGGRFAGAMRSGGSHGGWHSAAIRGGTAHAGLRNAAIRGRDPRMTGFRGARAHGWHGTAFRGGPRMAAFHGGPRTAAFHGGPRTAAFHGGGPRGGASHDPHR
jgi:hypothetical protein